MIGRTNVAGGGGGGGLNFRILGGTATPSSPKVNDIWVNTNTEISSWYFTATEPNVETLTRYMSDWDWKVNRILKDGDIVNFTIPVTVSSTFGSLMIMDSTGKMFFIRDYSGGVLTAWQGGLKVGLVISGQYALLMSQGAYYHEQGTVWISTGTSSGVAFNALKKNNIQVYPISAKQWINGAWVGKEAKSYQNSKWVDWILYLRPSERPYTVYTGNPSAYFVDGDEIVYTDFSTATINSMSFTFDEPVDASGFSKLKVTVDLQAYNTAADWIYTAIAVTTTKIDKAYSRDTMPPTTIASTILPKKVGIHEVEVDLSGISQDVYIAIVGGVLKARISNIRLEP